TSVLWLAFSSCAHVPVEASCASFGDVGYCLQPSTSSFSVTQSVERSYANGVERFIVYLEVKESDIRMVGLTPFGRRMLQIHSSAAHVSSDIPADAALNAQRILAGLQLAFWPLAQARAGVRGAAARLVETPDGVTRRLMNGETVVFVATCEGTRPLCRRARLHYETLGQSLLIEALEGSES
ncbi:MAG TPA: DUF3261 domain-containing protein, partial [Candidatus Elarobacter sp.]